MSLKEMGDKIECTQEERASLISTVNVILAIHNKTIHWGLTALDDVVNNTFFDDTGFIDLEDEFLLRCGACFLLDGTEPKLTQKILETLILTSNVKGVDLLKLIIQTKGLLLIQQGASSLWIRGILNSYLGIKEIKETNVVNNSQINTDKENLQTSNCQECRLVQAIKDMVKNNGKSYKACLDICTICSHVYRYFDGYVESGTHTCQGCDMHNFPNNPRLKYNKWELDEQLFGNKELDERLFGKIER